MEKELQKIKKAILILAEYLLNRNTAEEVRKIEEMLNDKFCSFETCKDAEPHFHCSECQSKNGHHSQQCKYKIAISKDR